MSRLDALRKRREEILKELAGLEQIRRGSVTQQYFEGTRKDGTKTRRGPYPLLTFKEKGKTVSRRIKDSQVESVYESQIQGFRRFQELTGELVGIGEQISDLALSEQGVKKTSKRKSRSKRTRKSSAS
jgi:hypothetical protein